MPWGGDGRRTETRHGDSCDQDGAVGVLVNTCCLTAEGVWVRRGANGGELSGQAPCPGTWGFPAGPGGRAGEERCRVLPGGWEGERGCGARNGRAAGERALGQVEETESPRPELSGWHRWLGPGRLAHPRAGACPDGVSPDTAAGDRTVRGSVDATKLEPPLPPHRCLRSCFSRSDIVTTRPNAGLGAGRGGVPVLCRGAFLRVRGSLRVRQGLGGPRRRAVSMRTDIHFLGLLE